MPQIDVRYATVPLSGQLSDIVAVAGADLFAVWVPVVTSCALTVRGSYDQNSANFVPLTNPAGSGDWTFAAGPGSRAITLQDAVFPFPFFKLFCGVPQAAVRSFAVVGKF